MGIAFPKKGASALSAWVVPFRLETLLVTSQRRLFVKKESSLQLQLEKGHSLAQGLVVATQGLSSQVALQTTGLSRFQVHVSSPAIGNGDKVTLIPPDPLPEMLSDRGRLLGDRMIQLRCQVLI